MIYGVSAKYRKYINDELFLEDFNQNLKRSVMGLINSEGEDLFKYDKIISLLAEEHIRFLYLVIDNCPSHVKRELIEYHLFEKRGNSNTTMFTDLKKYNKDKVKEYELNYHDRDYIEYLKSFMSRKMVDSEVISNVVLYLYHIASTNEFNEKWMEFKSKNDHIINPPNERIHCEVLLGLLDLENNIDMLSTVRDFAIKKDYYKVLEGIVKLNELSNRHRDIGRIKRCYHNITRDNFNLAVKMVLCDDISDKDLQELAKGSNYFEVYHTILALSEQRADKRYDKILSICAALGKINETVESFEVGIRDMVNRSIAENSGKGHSSRISDEILEGLNQNRNSEEELDQLLRGMDAIDSVIGEEQRLKWARIIKERQDVKLEDVIKDVDKALRGLEIKDLTQSLKTGNKQEVEIGAIKGGLSWDS